MKHCCLTLATACCLAAPAAAQGPTLVPATLRSISPTGVLRGGTIALTFDGINLNRAEAVVFDDPAITGTVKPGKSANQALVTAEVGPAARVGVHQAFLRTPMGTTGSVTFAVGGWPEIREAQGPSTAATAAASLPATFVGAITAPGQRDEFRFHAEAGQELVFEVVASQIRSRLQSVLTLQDARGTVLAEHDGDGGQPDALLAYRFSDSGEYVIGIRDFENAAGGDVTYRLNAGPFIHAHSVFPLGFRKGNGEVTLQGPNLGEGLPVPVAAESGGWGQSVTVTDTPRGPLLKPVRLAVGEEPEVLEAEPNNQATSAQRVSLPVTVNGRIDSDAGKDADYFRFSARKGQELVLEVEARRLGSPLDSVLEVLDANGKPIERATLRCIAETVTTLSDRDSASTGLRLLSWNDLAMNDLLYVRGEVIQITLLPRGPDDDTRFRAIGGQRIGLFDTTPAGVAQETPVYKVQVHPPGSRFSPNGMPVFHLYYRNDDGGPLYGKDSRVMFRAPADGEYVVRLGDIRGTGSDRHAYRLTIRDRRPDFRLSLNPAHPGIPAGSSLPVEVSVDRLDGFAGAVGVTVDHLPEGITATRTEVEAGESTATLLLSAAPGAKSAAVELRVTGRAAIDGAPRTHTISPGGGLSYLTVLPKADLTVRTDRRSLVIRPGEEQHLEASITRENGFAGRVPIDLKNLPYGVRVLDIGLNGVLIPEGTTSRRFTVYCEPWVKPQRRSIYCTVRTETGSSASTEVAALPIELEVAERQP